MATDEYEQELERELEALDEQADEVSKVVSEADKSESEQEPELDVATTDDVDAVEEPDGEPETTDDADSKEEATATEDSSKHPTVPIARLSQVSREKRKVERELRASNEKITDLQSKLESIQAQAEVQGIELHDAKSGFTEDDFKDLSDEYGSVHARTLINMQKQIDSLVKGSEKANTDDDPLMDAVVANNDAHEWFLADGDNWQKMKDLWVENQASLHSDFDTDEERVAHLVELMKGKPTEEQAPKPAPKGPSKSLGNVSGDRGTGGTEIDEVLAMGNRQVDYMEKLSTDDPVKYDRIMEGLRDNRMKKG